ncbi:MAG: RAMP superfamily CRISPR-associated protein, partial [Desulfosporosinus sp.]
MLDLNELKKETAINCEKFDFTILTPLFMHGWQEVRDNGRGRPVSRAVNAELRGPSLRGILRYWWRSLQKEGYSSAILLQKEQAFFGGSSGGDESGTRRSPLLLKISSLGNQALQETNKIANLCPHKKPGMSSLALAPGRRL